MFHVQRRKARTRPLAGEDKRVLQERPTSQACSRITHRAGVMKEGAVEGASDGLVAAEAEGDVGNAAADLATRTQPLDLPRRPANGIAPGGRPNVDKRH